MRISSLTVFLLMMPLSLQAGGEFSGNSKYTGSGKPVTPLSEDQTLTTRADSLNMRLVGHHPTSWSTRGIAVRDDYTYVADFMAGFRIISVADPENPVEVGYYQTPGEAEDVFIDGSYAYVADGSEDLRIISISDPANPVEVGHFETPDFDDFRDVAVSAPYAYTAEGNSGFKIYSVSDPTNPVLLDSYDTSGYSHAIDTGAIPNIRIDIHLRYVVVDQAPRPAPPPAGFRPIQRFRTFPASNQMPKPQIQVCPSASRATLIFARLILPS